MGPEPVNTNWGPALGAKQRVGGWEIQTHPPPEIKILSVPLEIKIMSPLTSKVEHCP